MKHLIILLTLIFCADSTKPYSDLEEYFKIKKWNYPIHFETNKEVCFNSYCGDTTVARDIYLNMSRDSYMDKVYDKKKLISQTEKFNSQVKNYLSYMLDTDVSYVSSPIFCLWPPSDSDEIPGTIYYAVNVREFFISNDGSIPFENCIWVENNIYKREMMVTFEVEKDSLGFVSWYWVNSNANK